MLRAYGDNALTAARLAVAGLLMMGPPTTALADDTKYRWVDDEGEVHYGDQMPGEQAKRKHEVIDDSGVVREERTPAEGSEEEEAEATGASGKADAQAQEGEGAGPEPRDDEMLLEAFPTEQMLIEARERRLGSLQSRIDLTRQNIERLASSYATRRERLSSLPEDSAQRREVEKQLRELERRMDEQRQHLSELQAKKAELEAQFKADLERYRELKAEEIEE